MKNTTILIAGLGNPGNKYQKNRHNIGFVVVDTLAYKFQADFSLNKKFNAEIAEINHPDLPGLHLILAKPQTYMNNSGLAIQKIAAFHKLTPEQIWVIFDELDLPLGTIKIRKSGSAGTHNGMKSIVGQIGKDFARFRIGIESRGSTASTFQDTPSFVLSDFFGPEKEMIITSVNQTVEAIEAALQYGLDEAMNKFN